MSEEIKKIGNIWRRILERDKISVEELRSIVGKEAPEALKSFDEIIEKLFMLGFIEYDGESVAPSTIIPNELVDMPCIRCIRVSTCKVGAKNDPLKCENFVDWFIRKFSEHPP